MKSFYLGILLVYAIDGLADYILLEVVGYSYFLYKFNLLNISALYNAYFTDDHCV